MSTILVTGGAGFIGSNYIRSLLNRGGDRRVVNFDALTYAGNLENLTDVATNPRYKFVKGDICDHDAVRSAVRDHGVDQIINFAAESHVDRSILGSAPFLRTNVIGTQVLLDVARECGVQRYLQVSTDEVYGSLPPTGAFTEQSPLVPSSPYAASKAAADLLVLSYHHTFGMPVLISRCSNNYGPYQFPEKLIPLMICNALRDFPLPVYGDGLNVRDWLHVDDHCAALDAILAAGSPGSVYNIGGRNEWTNLSIVRRILQLVGKPESLITFVKDRPGHDRRYATEAAKLRQELGWEPRVAFDEGLEGTVSWYRSHASWWTRVMTGEYVEYYRRNYSNA